MKAAKIGPQPESRNASFRVPDLATSLHLRRVVILIPATILGMALISPRTHIFVNILWVVLTLSWAVTMLSVRVDVQRFSGRQEGFLPRPQPRRRTGGLRPAL